VFDNIFSPGKSESHIHVGEAFFLWSQLAAWYDVHEFSEEVINHVKDSDLRFILEQGEKGITNNIAKLEGVLDHYKVTFPARPPKVLRKPIESMMTDESFFRMILDITQSALFVHVKSVNSCLNDSVRKLFMDFLFQEIQAFDILVKLGKKKGWVHNPPLYKLVE